MSNSGSGKKANAAIIALFVFFHCGVVWSQSLNIDEIKRKITPSHEILLEYEKLKFDMTPAGIKAAEEQAAEEARIIAELAEQQRREAEETERLYQAQYDRLIQEKNTASTETQYHTLVGQFRAMGDYKDAIRLASECNEQYQKLKILREQQEEAAKPLNVLDAVNKSGLSPSGFYMSSKRLTNFVKYGSATLKHRLDEAQANRKKIDKFDDAGIARADAEIKKAQADINNALVEIANKTFFDEYTYSISDSRNLGSGVSTFKMNIDMLIRPVQIGEISLPLEDVQWTNDSRSGTGTITLSITGSTTSIAELVNNKGNYRVKVWFKNLREGGFSGYGAAPSAVANVLKIEIIKVR